MSPEQVTEVRVRLQRLTTKTLTHKRPSVPCEDVLHAWPVALAILEHLLSGPGGDVFDPGQGPDPSTETPAVVPAEAQVAHGGEPVR